MSVPTLGDKYTCAACGGVFETAWTDEEAVAEYGEVFQGKHEPAHEADVVCDDCYQKMAARFGWGTNDA